MRRIDEFWIEFIPPEQEEKAPKTSTLLSLLYDTMDSVKGAVIVVFLVFALLFRAIGVDGNSMLPTLVDGDWVVISGITMSFERGDIVVVTQPWERNVPIIKRVIAVGGDTVDIDFNTHEVFVNGEKLYEPYISEPTAVQYDIEFPLTVDEGKIFVMGDNRNVSLDSRSSKIGLIDERYVFGKAVGRIYPKGSWNIYEDQE